jgi:RND family efflux transporter MFP subunit
MAASVSHASRLVAALWSIAAFGGFPPSSASSQAVTTPQHYVVAEQEVDDLKAVFATVRSKDRIEARVRTPGTVVTLKVDEGSHVEPGQVLALIADPKIALKIKALDAQILGLESRVATARLDYDRAEQLRQRGVTAQARVDQLKSLFEVASNELKSTRSERMVAEEQVSEGQVLAPAAGRVLKVPVTEGSVVMAGESIATIAANEYLLRIELPERHARFMRKGDPVRVGTRGLAQEQQAAGEGRIVMVYPELQGGRVVADAEVATLGDYFVGERVLAWISAGKRKAVAVPKDYVFKRFGLDYVRLAGDAGSATDVVVQLGPPAPLPAEGDGIEVLTGLKPGDRLLRPAERS